MLVGAPFSLKALGEGLSFLFQLWGAAVDHSNLCFQVALPSLSLCLFSVYHKNTCHRIR